MTKKLTTLSILLITLVLITGITAATHVLIPDKQTSESTFHSLNDIYNLIMSGTIKDVPNSPVFTTNTPTATTSHSIGEIYTILANIKVDKASSTTGSLIPTASASTDYTLEDIWNLINNGTYATKGAHLRTITSSPVPTMHTTSEIYDYLNTTFKNNLSLSKVRSGAYYFGNSNPGTFVIANLGEYCEANDECNTNYCGDDSYYCWETCTAQCTSGGIGSVCNNANQCSTGICGLGFCSDGSIGSMCAGSSDCTSGYCGDTNQWYGAPTCTDGSAGQYCGGPDSCAPGNYCNYNDYTCTATDGNLGSGCGDVSDCDAGLYCSQANYTCTNGTVGSSCAAADQCASGYCDQANSVCTTGAVGQGCGDNLNCASGYCNYGNSTCTNGDIGDGCTDNSSCQSGYCDLVNSQCSDGSLGSGCTNNNQCSSNLCSSVTHECISGVIGSSCTVAQECTSTYCDTYNNICTDGDIGVGCGTGSDCAGGICSSLNNSCSLGETGSACGVNSDCETGHCSSGNICEIIPLSTGVVGYWSFDSASSTTVYDGTANGNNGTLAGNAYIDANGKLGSATTYDGSMDRMSIPNRAIFKTQNFSFSAWVKKSGSRYNEAVYLHQGNGYNIGWRVFVSGSNVWYQWGSGTSWLGDVSGSGSINTSQWFHLAVVRDEGGYVNIYINGVLSKRQATSNIGYSATSASYTAFGDSAGVSGFTGSIDDLALWNRTLSAYDVQQLYNNGDGRSPLP